MNETKIQEEICSGVSGEGGEGTFCANICVIYLGFQGSGQLQWKRSNIHLGTGTLGPEDQHNRSQGRRSVNVSAVQCLMHKKAFTISKYNVATASSTDVAFEPDMCRTLCCEWHGLSVWQFLWFDESVTSSKATVVCFQPCFHN